MILCASVHLYNMSPYSDGVVYSRVLDTPLGQHSGGGGNTKQDLSPLARMSMQVRT
jgi:hypothetical protein